MPALAMAASTLSLAPSAGTSIRITSYNVCYTKLLRAHAAGLEVSLGGTTAVMADFDHELLSSLPRVAAAVLLLTFVVLALLFRSVLIPLKATVLNLLSVLAAYGFLVYVFQDGIGARARITSYNVCYTKLLRSGV